MLNRQPSHSHALPLAANSISLIIGLQNCLSSISSDKPLKQCKSDILSFIQRMGPEGQKLAITSLMENLQQPQAQDKLATSYRWSLLAELLKQYSPQDSFFSYFPQILYKHCSNKDKLGQYMTNIYNNLKLPLNIQISISLALYLSDRGELISIGQNDLISKVKEYACSQKQVKLPQKILDQLLFQININPELSNKLDNQTKYLLETAEKVYKSSDIRIYNYFRNQWPYFSNETPVIEKPQPISLRKSDVLRDLGPSVTHQIDTLKAVISQIGALNEQDIFDCLMMMAEEKTKQDSNLDRFIIDLMCLNSNTKKNVKGEELKKIFNIEPNNKKMQVSWNIDNFLQYIIQNIQNIKWQNVLSSLDKQNLEFSSDQHFVEIMKYFEKIKRLIKKWSLNDSIFLKKWVHAESQAQFLIRLYSCKDPQCLFFNENQPKKGQNSSTKQNSSNSLRQIWSSLELVTLMFQVSDYKRQRLKQILDTAISKYSDTLIKTLSQIKPNKGKQLVHETFLKIFPQYLQMDGKCIKLLETVWNSNRQLFIQSISQLHKKSKKNRQLDLEKLVQIFQQIQGCLNSFTLDAEDSLAIPIALIAGKKQYINMQKWIGFKIDQNQQKFSKQLIHYLESHLFKQLRLATQSDQKQVILQQSQLTIETLNKIFTATLDKLKQEHPQSKHNETLKKLQKQCCKLIPEIAQGQIYEQAERECEQQIKKIYKQEISIKDAVQNLKRLKNSNKKQEMQHFANRITFLCIQLTYHHSYPEKELMITADLFSALINAHLMEKKIYQTFLHVIDQYLKEDNQQFAFAMKVMMNIKEKLAHQSWFCEKLIDNELVMRKDPQLVQSIIKSIQPPKVLSIQKQRKLKQAIKQKNTPSEHSRRMILQPQAPSHTHPQHEPKPSPPIEYDILGTLDRSKKMQIADRESKLRIINTICNTLSLTNIEEKSRELKKILDSQKVYKLLSYRILKIVSITQNSGVQVFIRLIDLLPKAEKFVTNITYQILRSWFGLVGKSVNNDKKFGHFKNIGSWLGRITIGKGFPIPMHKLNLRQILTNSYLQSNRLGYTIPVVIRILQPIVCHPQIFRIESPWLNRIMGTLNEIEININTKQQQSLKNQIKAFFKATKFQAALENMSGFHLLGHVEEQQLRVQEEVEKVNISEELIAFCQGFGIGKTQIRGFLDSSVVEILDPVVERAVKISKTTTKQMINKDFALQISSQKVKESSVNLVRQLAAPLAQVTCRQPLKTAIAKKIRELIKQKQEGTKIKQQEIQSLTQKILIEILDPGCLIIKQKVAKAAQKSIREDIEIIETLEMRNYLKKSGTPLTNQSYMSTIPSVVPQQLRPSQSGLSQQQYQIYRQLKRVRPKVEPSPVSSSALYSVLLQSLTNHEPIEQLLKKMSEEQLTEQFLIKLHKMMLDENNDENDIQYYLNICKEIKEYGGQDVNWKLFKNVADFKNNQKHIRIFRKLLREKYFDQSVLDQIYEEENNAIALFQKWMALDHEQANQFVTKLQAQLTKLSIKKQTFYFYCLKHILKQSFEQHSLSYNPNYVQQLVQLALSLCSLSAAPIQILQPLLEQTVSAACRACEKSSQSQRLFFKMITTLTESVCQEASHFSQQNKVTYVCILARNLNRINPLGFPAFAFAWLEIVCNHNLIRYLLNSYQFWDLYAALLTNLLKFLNENVNQTKLYNEQHGQVYQRYYLAVLKLIIVLIHDYSQFLSAFSLELCLLLDGRFIQLRNIINSAYPSKQLEIPLKFEKREDLQSFVQKVGYPKYYKLNFDKKRLNVYLSADYSDPAIRQKLQRTYTAMIEQDDLFLQTLILYHSWQSQHQIPPSQTSQALLTLLTSFKSQFRQKLLNFIINLIRYPNHITLFFIDFVSFVIFKQNHNKEIKQNLLEHIVTRMKGEVPIAWGLIYLVEFVLVKKDLEGLGLTLFVENS